MKPVHDQNEYVDKFAGFFEGEGVVFNYAHRKLPCISENMSKYQLDTICYRHSFYTEKCSKAK